MKWGQFQLWRMFAAMAMLGVSLAAWLAIGDDVQRNLLMIVLAVGMLGGAIGTLWRSGVAAALMSALGFLLFILAIILSQFVFHR